MRIIAAQAIIAYRNNLENGIEDVSELSSEGIISSDMLSTMQDYLTVSSNIYKISCIGTANRGGIAGTNLKQK